MISPKRAATVRIAVVGLGKVAREQHLPALAVEDRFTLTATVSPDDAGLPGIPHFRSLDALLDTRPALDAVALCTPPQVRSALAAQAISAGLHVLLEKPPGTTLTEVEALTAQAARAGTTLFAAWHSRFASGVAPAREWLLGRTVLGASIDWREDVRTWHPGQRWIWEPGGLGVFDPGINALSIATAILPSPLRVDAATLAVPLNRAAPIAARLRLRTAAGAPVSMNLDWRQTGHQTWDIRVETDEGPLLLAHGGASLSLPGDTVAPLPDREYPALYERFHELVRTGASDVDLVPLRLVADAFLIGCRETTPAFDD
ncbi:Gfo/Idh/MocA family oxidoreductase [Luteitalea sp.]|uniref:Gfo/Idh/MocA family protein n=1 Tax=Luteitalea sp. TaxID=2004800 RepID=UPI0025BFFEDC|nr:Gfo/Idh/MocA family oxidoreductase [Luteitalea sp.]